MSLYAVLAQAALATAPVTAPAAQGVTAYPPAFFADYRPNTALEMVNRLPGFTLDVGESVRGFEGAAGNVLIDGVRPASKTDDLDDILGRIPAGQVERIDLIRGGAPGIDMQGKTVLANVVRKKGGRMQGLVQLSDKLDTDFGRNFVGLRAEGSGAAAGGQWEAALRTGGGTDDGASNTVYLVIEPDGRIRDRSQIKAHAEVRDVTLTGAYEHGLAGGRLKVNGRAYYEHYRFNEASTFLPPNTTVLSNEDGQELAQSEVGLRYDRALTSRTRLEVVGLRQTEHWDYHSNATIPLNDFNYGQDARTVETIGRTVLRFRQNDRMSWEGGAEFAVNTLDSTTEYKVRGTPADLPAAQAEVKEQRGEIFAKAVWQPTTTWTFEGGLRQEGSKITSDTSNPDAPDRAAAHTEKTLYFTKPRVTGAWQARPGTQLRLRFERVVGQLDFDDFVSSASLNEGVVRAGNVDLVPEQAWVTEASVEQRFWLSAVVTLTARHFALDDTIDRAPIYDASGVFDAPANIGQGTKDELQLDVNIPLDRIGILRGEFRGFVVARRSEVTDPTTGSEREISGLRPLEWEAHYNQQLPSLKLAYGVDVYGGWRRRFYRFDEISTDKLRTYVVLFAEWKPSPTVLVRGEVMNATSRGFRRNRQIFAGPRNTSELQVTYDRDVDVGPMFYMHVRKSFGG